MRRHLLSIAAAAFLVAATPALAAKNSLPPPDSTALLAPAAADYRIGAQDVLEVNVFGIEDLKREVQVDSGGKVILPLIGQIQAGGRTPGEFSEDVEKALKARYMKDPQVIVTVKNAQSQRVTIDGAVNKPGVYPLSGPTTLLQAISLGGGPDQKLANVKKVAVFRQVGGKRHAATFNLNEIRSGKSEDPQIYGNDIVVVDTSGGSKFIQNFQGVFPLLGLFAW
ncbi:polysaccharide biosynthesis/export family protein [Phenylobacterium sp.]|uniref:polysaccharide biosynthesis/export family protein n=1 Tax=Phenylobacterium sp. TaxID=1871053 RepID=UPI002810F591|nr:polysaccharide biosynthesis/export family protein [Phenylobacterium sp.]